MDLGSENLGEQPEKSTTLPQVDAAFWDEMFSERAILEHAAEMRDLQREQDRIDRIDESLGFDRPVCGDCRTFPLSWFGRRRHCRTVERVVYFDMEACEELQDRTRPETFGVAQRKLSAYQDKLAMLAERLSEMPAVIERRKKHWNESLAQRLIDNEMGGVVYFIDCLNMTKIGYSTNAPQVRALTWITGNPFGFRLAAVIPGPPELERELQAEFEEQNFKREWFRLSPADRRRMEKIVIERGGVIVNEILD